MSPSLRPLPIFLLFSLATSCFADIVTLRRDRRGTAAALSSVDQVEDLHFLPPAGTDPGDGEDDHLELLDIVLLASVDGKFHALKRATGEHLWSMPSTASFTSIEPQSDAARTVLSTLRPLVSTQHSNYSQEVDDDTYLQETYIIEPQSGDIYVTSSPAEPLQRLPFSVPQLVDMSPFSFGDSDRRVFVGRKKTSLLLLELETGRVKAALDSECPWDPFDDFTTRDPMDADVDLDELDGTKPSKSQYPQEIFIGRAGGQSYYHISIHTRPLSPSAKRPPVQNLSFSTYGPNNQDLQQQAAYRRTVDDTYVEPLPNGEVIAFKTRGIDQQEDDISRNTFVWGQRFSHPIVAVFDIVKNRGRAHPFVLLQPRPRLKDIIPDIDLRTASQSHSRPDPESAYVGLVEETGSLFAMSPDHFPLVVFGADDNRQHKTIDAPPGSMDGRASAQKASFDLDKLCREGSTDRRCAVGIRPLRADSRSRLARLLDGAPADALPLPPSSNSQTPSTGERDSGLVQVGNLTYIPPWPWSAVGLQPGQLGDVSFGQPTSVFACVMAFIIALGAFFFRRRRSRGQSVHTPVMQEKLGSGDISPENTPVVSAKPPVNVAFNLAIPDAPPMTNALAVDAKMPIERVAEPPEPQDDPGDDETDKEGENANTPGKRKTARRRRGKKKKGPKDIVAEDEAEEKLTFENGDVQEIARATTPLPSPSLLVLPSTPTPIVAPSLIVSDTVLGFGSHGTVVYEGSLQGRAVAVKRLLQDFVTLAAREVTLLQDADDHPNVIRYYYQESQANFLYIALELCPASLADIIERPDQHRDIAISFDPKRALRQITSGLRHLHALKIVHRDIKPQNILVSSAKKGVGESAGHRMLISDFGLCRKLELDQTSFLPTANGMMGVGTVGWRAPEILKGEVKLDETTGDDNSQSSRDSVGTATGGSTGSTTRPTRLTKSVDIFALGCLFYYTLTNGGHPFGDRYEREANILRNTKMLEGLEQFGEEGSEAVNLIGKMLEPEASERCPGHHDMSDAPVLLGLWATVGILQDASDRFEIMCRDPKDPELLRLEEGAIDVVGPDWPSRLDKIFVENLGKFRKYDGRSVQDLLRALRNKKHHYQDLPDNVKRHVGSMPEGYLHYFTRRFPRLFLHVHSVISTSSLRRESMFRSYFNVPD